MKRKLLLIGMMLFMVLFGVKAVYADAAFFYPSNYYITINNIDKNDIKKIEVIQKSDCAINYETNNQARSWIDDTDFGKKYKDNSDEEIIPKLTTEEIDQICKSYIGKDASKVDGYWVESKDIKLSNSIVKFEIYKNVDVNYKKDSIEINYFSDNKNNNTMNYLMNSKYLRIEKNDGTILYSDVIRSKLETIIDENTANKDKSVTNKNAYFEIDYTDIENKFDVIELDEPNESVTDEKTTSNKISNNVNDSNKDNVIAYDFSYIYVIVLVGVLVILLSIVIIILKTKNK